MTEKPQPDDEQLRALLNIARYNQSKTHMALAVACVAMAAIAVQHSSIVVSGGWLLMAVWTTLRGVAPYSNTTRRVLSRLPGGSPQAIDRPVLERADAGEVWADGGEAQ